jgi:hypothetical protein
LIPCPRQRSSSETDAPYTNRAILSRRAIALCERAGIKGSAHFFRDTFACDMLTRGIGVFEVAQMLADTVETVEEYYAQFVPAARDAVQSKMDSGVGIEAQAKIAAQRVGRLWGYVDNCRAKINLITASGPRVFRAVETLEIHAPQGFDCLF